MVSTSGGTGFGYASMSKTLNAHSPPPMSMAANKSTSMGQRSASETSRRIMSQHSEEQDSPADHNLLAALDAGLERHVFAFGHLLHCYWSPLEAELAIRRGSGLRKQDRLFA